MVEVIANGELTKRYAEGSNQERVNITYGGFEAHLGLYRFEERQTWVITGYEVTQKASDATGEGSGSSGATLFEDIPRTNEGGAEASDNSKSSPPQKDKGGFASKDQTYFLPDDNDNELERYGRSIGEAGAGRGGEAARRRGET